MSIQLKRVIRECGLTQAAIAQAISVSPALIAQLCNHGIWPKSPKKQRLTETICEALKSHGASAATLATVFDADVPPTNQQPEDNDMILRKQELRHATRKHFALFNDPFAEPRELDDVFSSPDVAYVRQVLTQVQYGERFMAIVGESGAGKSTIRREYIETVRSHDLPIVIIEPYVLGLEDNDKKGKSLKAVDIAAAIIRTLDPQARIRSTAEARFHQLHNVLRESRRSGNRHVLIIEEAHSLSIATLKHLKRFYELEDGLLRLLSIVLIGQPELAEKLNQNNPHVREVVSRLEVVRLEALDGHLTEYLSFRFARIGKKMDEVLDNGALDALRIKLTVPSRDKRGTALSLLYPQAVNNQVTAALNLAAELGAPRVTADIMRSV